VGPDNRARPAHRSDARARAVAVAARRRAATVGSQPRDHDQRSLQGARLMPRTSCRRSPDGRWYRGIVEAVLRREWSATSNCAHGGVLRAWDTTAPTRRLVMQRWCRRAASPRAPRAGVWSGCLVGRKHASATAGRRCGPLGSHESATIPRYHRPCGVRRQGVRGTLFGPATTLYRGNRPSEHPGRATASSQPPAKWRQAATVAPLRRGCPTAGRARCVGADRRAHRASRGPAPAMKAAPPPVAAVRPAR
jgi:hypothetical protein